MSRQIPAFIDDIADPADAVGETSEADLWFLPGPPEEEPDVLPPGPRGEPGETSVLSGWRCGSPFGCPACRRMPPRWPASDGPCGV